MVWLARSGMVSVIKFELYCHSVTISLTSSGATVSVCTSLSVSDILIHSRRHSFSFRTSQTALSSTCLQCYLPQSLPGSQIPTVSAHVNREITGHAHTHICFAFKRLISVCTQAICSFSPLFPPPPLFFDKQSRWGSKRQGKGHKKREERCVEMMNTHWWCVFV